MRQEGQSKAITGEMRGMQVCATCPTAPSQEKRASKITMQICMAEIPNNRIC